MATKKKAAAKKPAAKKVKSKKAAGISTENFDQTESAGATIHSQDGKTIPCAENETE